LEKQEKMGKLYKTLDGNEAAASVAYRVSEVIAIYPITPSSTMAEWADEWAAAGKKNIWDTIPKIAEMQSEGGAAGAIHGSLQNGAISTTFTASQGLLLMIPNMYKIAGELTPAVFHIAARALAYQGLSIFGDHSDVMSARVTGFAMLASNSVQEAHDMALIAHTSTLNSRVPFLHFFDGFRTSHEVQKIEMLDDETIKAMIPMDKVYEHRHRSLRPERPVMRGTAQNSDVYFQGREASNKYYQAVPGIVQEAMDNFAKLTGRQYKIFDYYGAPDAERVIVLIGSACEAAEEAIDVLTAAGEKIGMVKVHLYRPFDISGFAKALPSTVKSLAVLDRVKEPGSLGEPLYQDVLQALANAVEEGLLKTAPKVYGGRYGLASKEFTPAMVKGVFDNLLAAKPKNHFTVGINDDVTFTSIPYDAEWSTEPDNVTRAMFYGLGSDGTVGANKNSIKIICEKYYGQGYFEYDSKKSGSTTVSHLRFGPNPIKSSYLINKANFIACHQTVFTERLDMLKNAAPNGVFLLNTTAAPDKAFDTLPLPMQKQIIDKKIKFYVIDAYDVAEKAGMGTRINTVMQACFFAISNVMPKEEAIEEIKKSIKKTYAKKGDDVVAKNIAAVDSTLANLYEAKVPAVPTSKVGFAPSVRGEGMSDFVKNFTGEVASGRGNDLPVSAVPDDGTFPTATTQYEKRNIANYVPVWDPATCIQCTKCSLVCSHAAIRSKVYDAALLSNAPETFKSADAKMKDFAGMKFTIQIAVEDCTGCGLCVSMCPAKSKADPTKKAITMGHQAPLRATESKNWAFFMDLPEPDRSKLNPTMIQSAQLMRPLFEFSGACAGCGETSYIKLITQLFGDRMCIANATGCSSIYGGNLPTTPYCVNKEGLGPAWNNSLFEDNAEFGMGYRLAIDKQTEYAKELLAKVADKVGADLVAKIMDNPQKTEAEIAEQRKYVAELKSKLSGECSTCKNLLEVADYLVKKVVWIIGGDGWAYDIGYGGLDHVLGSGQNVNVLVVDTEVYSNTGGQMSKSTPRGAVAKFAASGRAGRKKDLGMMAMTYGNVYVAAVAIGANDSQTLKAFVEAEKWDGPSLIIAYSHCINHGIDMSHGIDEQKAAVDSGAWLLYRYNPALEEEGKNPLTVDSREAKISVGEYMKRQNRFKILAKANPERAAELAAMADVDAKNRYQLYKYMASQPVSPKAE